MVTAHSVQLLFMKNCSYPRLFAYWILSYAVIFLVMFANFYIQAYRRKPHQGSKKSESNGTSQEPNGAVVTNGKEKTHWRWLRSLVSNTHCHNVALQVKLLAFWLQLKFVLSTGSLLVLCSFVDIVQYILMW